MLNKNENINMSGMPGTQEESIKSFISATELLYKSDFANAESVMEQYRQNINYDLFEKTDNRKNTRTELSVIIVAYSTNNLLMDCLKSVIELNDGPYEIIVVDNGKNESVEETIKQMPVLYIKCPYNFILSEGRNIGVHYAKSPIVSFLDDDAVVKAGYVNTILKAFGTFNISGLRGKVLEKTPEWADKLPKSYNLGEVPVPASIDAEGNSAFLRDRYLEFNGMNPLLFGGEGLDFTLRIIQKYGLNTLIYWPETVIYHNPADEKKDNIKADRYKVMHQYLEWKYPNLWAIYSYLEQNSLNDEKRLEGFNKIEKKATAPADAIGSQKNLTCMFVATYYNKFIEKHYNENPALFNAGYDVQLNSLLGRNFGDSNYYSNGFRKAGWNAQDVICNCLPLQNAWKNEHNIQAEGFGILIEQIKYYKPDVVYFQDMNLMPAEFLNFIRPFVKLIAGQIATPIEKNIPFNLYDVIFSSFPHYIKKFREAGLTAYYQPLAFDGEILKSIDNGVNNKSVACSFVGGISAYHVEGNKLLSEICSNIPVQVWGYGVENLPQDSPIRSHYISEAWGQEMFDILAKSLITINRHGEVAENYANNMRLFEATGCGALLVTDYKDNLNELFEIGKEIVAFRSTEEAIALIKYYLAHPQEALEIAMAGQKRTLTDHTYEKRMRKSAEILERHINYKAEKQSAQPVDYSKISYGYKPVNKNSIKTELTQGWKDESIPQKQRNLVQLELEMMYAGKTPEVYTSLADMLYSVTRTGSSILEVGCSSGYYYEILEYLLNRQLNYTGVDYSEHFITMAKKYYPGACFKTADGAALPFENNTFDVVISGSVILHVADYAKHILESVRTAKNYIAFHRIPVCRKKETQYLKKFAYGVETLELRFNEKDLLKLFSDNGTELVEAKEIAADSKNDSYTISYLLKKHNQNR